MLTLTYNGNGNTGGSGTQIVYGSGDKVVSGVGNLTKTGYTFYGWNTSADGTGTTYLAGSTITVSSSVTLYAMWNAMVTFTTSKLVGQEIAILVGTTTNYYKYIHNGSETVLDIKALNVTYQIGQNRIPVITVENSNGEFTIISCLEDGTPSGYIYSISLHGSVYTDPVNGFTRIYNNITSFNGAGLSGLELLSLNDNLLTSLNLNGLTSLRHLEITGNPLTRSENDSILNQLNSSNINNGIFRTSNGRTSSGTTAYNSLISRDWSLTGVGVGNDWWT
jgi:uncharacterized repeat protein (TIGR02543 family)